MLRKFEESDPNHPGLYIQTSDYGRLSSYVEITKPMTIDTHHYHWFRQGAKHFLYLKDLRPRPQVRLVADAPPVLQRHPGATSPVAVLYRCRLWGDRFPFLDPRLVGYKKEKEEPVLEDGKLVPTILAQGEAISAAALDLKKIGPILVKLRHEAVYHTETTLSGTEKVPKDHWVQLEGDSCLVSIFRDEKKGRYLMPVNHAIDKARDLTLTFANEVMGLEKMDRKTGTWTAMKLEPGDDGRRVAFSTRVLGDGQSLRVTPVKD